MILARLRAGTFMTGLLLSSVAFGSSVFLNYLKIHQIFLYCETEAENSGPDQVMFVDIRH
jgi:hypothetical protein